MASVYEAIGAYELPGKTQEEAWTQVEKGKVGIKGQRREMKKQFKLRAKEAMARAKKAQERAARRAKRKGKLLGKLTAIIPGPASAVVGALGQGYLAKQQAKEMKKFMKQAGGVAGFQGTFLGSAEKDFAKSQKEMIDSIDPDEAGKAALLAGAASGALGGATGALGDWAKGKGGKWMDKLKDKIGKKIDAKDMLKGLDEKTQELFKKAEKGMGKDSIADLDEMGLKGLQETLGLDDETMEKFKEYKGMREGLETIDVAAEELETKIGKEYEEGAVSEELVNAEGEVVPEENLGMDEEGNTVDSRTGEVIKGAGEEIDAIGLDAGKPKYRFATWEELNPAKSAQTIGEHIKKGVGIGKGKPDYFGGKSFLENIAESGFGEGGFGKGGVLATLGKRVGGQIAAPFTKEGRGKLFGGDMSPLDFYKGYAPGVTQPDYSYIAGGDPVGQSESAVEQILANLPSDYYGGR